MPTILSKLPFYPHSEVLLGLDGLPVRLGGEPIKIRAFQIVIWIGISSAFERLDEKATRVPAILDTGHSDYFSIQAVHLQKWAGLASAALDLIGETTINDIKVPSHEATIWLQPNMPLQRGFFKEGRPFRLAAGNAGITVYPAAGKDSKGRDYPKNYPRLPVIGMRGLSSNRLRLSIDFRKSQVFLRSPSRLGW